MSLSGDLTEFALTELLQVLSLGRKSGVLSLIKADAARGTITLRRGRLVDAEVEGGAVGEEAFFALVATRKGRFVFRGTREQEPARQSIQRPLDVLLLEANAPSQP